MAKDPYKLLGVPKTASDAEIRKAYRSLAKKYHPDVNKDPKSQERFKEISAAHTLLSDKDMKKRYDSGQVDGSGQQQNPFAGGRNPFNTGLAVWAAWADADGMPKWAVRTIWLSCFPHFSG